MHHRRLGDAQRRHRLVAPVGHREADPVAHAGTDRRSRHLVADRPRAVFHARCDFDDLVGGVEAHVLDPGGVECDQACGRVERRPDGEGPGMPLVRDVGRRGLEVHLRRVVLVLRRLGGALTAGADARIATSRPLEMLRLSITLPLILMRRSLADAAARIRGRIARPRRGLTPVQTKRERVGQDFPVIQLAWPTSGGRYGAAIPRDSGRLPARRPALAGRRRGCGTSAATLEARVVTESNGRIDLYVSVRPALRMRSLSSTGPGEPRR